MVFRARRGRDHYLTWKVRLFAIGATLGLAGMFLEIRELIWAAIVVLVVGFLLRFFQVSGSGSAADARAEDDGGRSEDRSVRPGGNEVASEDEPSRPDHPGSS